MFLVIMFLFMLVGTLMCTFDMFMPGLLLPIVSKGMTLMGVMVFWIGPILFAVRTIQTGAHVFTGLANPKDETILIVQSNSGAKFIKTKKDILNTLLYKKKKMRFKDMGGGTRIAGHDVSLSSETCGITMPIWLVDYIQKLKDRYEIDNEKELFKLYEKLKGVGTYEDLYNISELKPLMSDPEKRNEIRTYPIKDIRLMAETIYDGRTINIQSYIEFDERSSPYDNETIINRTVAHREDQNRNYAFGAMGDWGKIAIPLVIILIMGAIAYQIFAGGGA